MHSTWHKGQVVGLEPEDPNQEPTSGTIIGVFYDTILVVAGEDKRAYLFNSSTGQATESTYENTGFRGKAKA